MHNGRPQTSPSSKYMTAAKKQKKYRSVSGVAIQRWWCIAQQFFEVDSTTLKLGAFFGRSNSRASLWLARLGHEDTPDRMHADVKPTRRQADLLCNGSAGRFSFQGESALPYSHLSPATSNFILQEPALTSEVSDGN